MTEKMAVLVFSGGGLALTVAVAWMGICAAMRTLTRRMPDPALPRLGHVQTYTGYDPLPELRYRYRKACEASRLASAQRRHLKKALKQMDAGAATAPLSSVR